MEQIEQKKIYLINELNNRTWQEKYDLWIYNTPSNCYDFIYCRVGYLIAEIQTTFGFKIYLHWLQDIAKGEMDFIFSGSGEPFVLLEN